MGCLLLYKMETIRESVKRGMGGAIYGIASVTIFVRFLQMQRINRIKENNNCLTCEVVITKEFREAPISIVQGHGGPIEMAQMVKTLTDVAESLKREFPEINEIIPMLNRNGGMRTAYKQVESWGRF